jgi:hypothetical protein
MRLPLYSWILLVIIAVTGWVVIDLLAGETPHGRFAGTLLAADTGEPLRKIAVTAAPDASSRRSYRATTDEQGRFLFPHLPVGAYTLTTDTQAHQQPGQGITIREGRAAVAIFELQPTAPFLRVFQRQRVFTTREEPKLRIHGFAPTGELSMRVYRIAQETVLANPGGVSAHSLNLRGQDIGHVNLDAVPQLTFVNDAKLQIGDRDRDGEGVFRKELSTGLLPPGTYLAAVEAIGLRELAPFAVTDLGLIVKAAPGQTLVYAVDIDSGKAVSGADLLVLWNGKEVAKSRTDRDGLASLALPKGENYGELAVIGRAEKSQAIAHLYSYWYEGNSPLRAYTYTDRPVYRPGHTVGFKSILRELKGNDYQVPAKEAVSVRVTDERENLVHAGRYTTSDFGSLAGSFALSEDALPGSYSVTVNARGGHYSDYFTVAEYRKPEYEVEIATPKKRYHRGQAIPATITARYYYGAPVPNARVEYYVTRSQYWYYGESDAWDEDIAESEYHEGEEVIYGTGRTDAGGRLAITITAKERKNEPEGQDWRYTVYAMVTDAGERTQDGQSSVLVTQGAFRLEARPEDWVAQPEQPVAVKIRAVDYDGKPVAGARGTAVFARVRWDDGRERLLEPVKRSWSADADGRATITVTPKRDGDYRLTVTAKDREGNRITATAGVWVMSDRYASFNYPYQDIDIRADRDLYGEGDTAQIVVNTRHAPITALLTIEGPRLLEHRLVELKGNSTVLPVTIRPEFMPSVRAGVCFLKGKKFFSGDAPLNVSRDKKALHVVVTSNKQKYGPGEEAVYRVKTLAPDGTPVQAEVSLGLVDEAIYGIAPEHSENIVSYFYPKRAHEVRTAFSFPEIYLSGDNKAGSKIHTRRRFLDTAFWNPTTVTDRQGEATFTLTLPDNLTTWRATARAATRDTRVGQTTAKAVVSKPFSVRLEPPRFFTQGDRVQLAAVSHNLSGGDLSARFGLNVTGLRLASRPERAVRIGNGQTSRTEWEAEVLDPGLATVRVWGQGGKLDDAMELMLPILPRGREKVEAYQGAVEESVSRVFSINEACIPGTQGMTLRLTPSLASAMLGSLDYLANYPYGCVEQTMSSFLPDVVIKEMLDTLKIDNPELRKELPKMVQAGLLKLYAMQHDDGGWGWWEYDETDPWMTAYVINGLAKARRAGFPVNPNVMESGIAALKRVNGSKPEMAGFIALALAEAGQRKSVEALIDQYIGPQGAYRLARLNDWNKLMLAQAMALVGKEDKGREIVSAMWRNFRPLGTDGPAYNDWWSENDFDAVLLAAAVRLTPDDPRLPELVRKLMARRQDGHWYSTRDTAFILYGLSRYLLHTRELEPDMTVRVLLNGKQVAARRFTGEDIFQPEFTLKLDAKDVTGTKPKLEIVKEGRGQLYYSASLTQSVALALEQKVATTDLRVERAYRKVRRDLARRGTADTEGSTPQIAFRNGDIIEVTLTVRSQRGYEYLMLEDMLPAGCEVLDRGKISRWEWNDWWCGEIIRDEMMGFPLRSLRPGVRRVKYYLVAQVPGAFTALPPRVYDMYRPEWRGEGVGQIITIR